MATNRSVLAGMARATDATFTPEQPLVRARVYGGQPASDLDLGDQICQAPHRQPRTDSAIHSQPYGTSSATTSAPRVAHSRQLERPPAGFHDVPIARAHHSPPIIPPSVSFNWTLASTDGLAFRR